MRKKFLERRLQRLQSQLKALEERTSTSNDANELRSIASQVDSLKADIEDVKEELQLIEEEERAAAQSAANPAVPANATLVNGQTRGSFEAPANTRTNRLGSEEYRQAFMDYVLDGTPIPAEFRNGEVTSTKDTGAAIPITVMNEVINTVRKRYGNLYSKVKKTSVAGGVEYPVGALEASFKWINESTVSPRQKAGELGSVIFKYNVGEIRIARTFLENLLTLSAFEAKITEVIAIAYLQAMDFGIINGSGQGSMLGILNDPRVTNTITMTDTDINDWTQWRKKFFAKLPLGYRSGEFVFPVSTVDSYLETMADNNNNPIFRQATGLEVFDGDALNPNGRFFGRNISLVEEDIIADFDTAQKGDVIGLYWQPEEYAINENFGFTMRRYYDEETNEWVDKAIVVVDGKTLNPTGFYKIIKG